MKKIIITESQYKRLFTEEMVYNIDGDIDIKGRELSNGGPVSDQWSPILNYLDDLLDESGIKYKITAGNDKFHKRANPKSRHAIGCAVDFAIRRRGTGIRKSVFNKKYASKVFEVMQKMVSKFSSSHDFSWLDEYNKGTGHSTGGHIHMSIGRQFCGGPKGKEIKSTQKLPSDAGNFNSDDIKDTPTSTSSNSSDLIKMGSKGDKVVELQTKLKSLNYDLGTTGNNKDGIDGAFGSNTQKAVRKFQTDKKIRIDGIVGPETKKELGLA